MRKFVKNGEYWQFSQNRHRRYILSILPQQGRKRNTSSVNELGEIRLGGLKKDSKADKL